METPTLPQKNESSTGPVVFMLITHVAPLLVVLWMLLYGVPRFIEFFKSVNATLPVITERVVNLSLFVSCYFFVMTPIVVLLLGADAAIFYALRRSGHRALAWTWGILVVGLLLLALLLIQVALSLPFVVLTEQMGNQLVP